MPKRLEMLACRRGKEVLGEEVDVDVMDHRWRCLAGCDSRCVCTHSPARKWRFRDTYMKMVARRGLLRRQRCSRGRQVTVGVAQKERVK
jgi:hypothetical protein